MTEAVTQGKLELIEPDAVAPGAERLGEGAHAQALRGWAAGALVGMKVSVRLSRSANPFRSAIPLRDLLRLTPPEPLTSGLSRHVQRQGDLIPRPTVRTGDFNSLA